MNVLSPKCVCFAFFYSPFSYNFFPTFVLLVACTMYLVWLRLPHHQHHHLADAAILVTQLMNHLKERNCLSAPNEKCQRRRTSGPKYERNDNRSYLLHITFWREMDDDICDYTRFSGVSNNIRHNNKKWLWLLTVGCCWLLWQPSPGPSASTYLRPE